MKISASLVLACGNLTEFLETSEHPIDGIAFLVTDGVDHMGLPSGGPIWNDSADATAGEPKALMSGVEILAGEQIAGPSEAIGVCTIRSSGCAVSCQMSTFMEEPFAWIKIASDLRKVKYCGAQVDAYPTIIAETDNFISCQSCG